MDDCQIVETEPDATKENDTIISIEKAGFRRNGRLLRLADVIVVKTNDASNFSTKVLQWFSKNLKE